jgi:GNAT superfamily N-acetyltransferase
MRLVKDGGLQGEDALSASLCGRFAVELRSGELAAWLCMDGDEAVAAGGVAFPRDAGLREELGLGPGEALVLCMFTRAGYRRRGIAGEILSLAIGEARSRGAAALRLQPTDDGRPLYERSGFRDSGRDMLLELEHENCMPGLGVISSS